MLEMLENISIKTVNYGMNIDGINAKFEHIRKQAHYKNERRELEQGIPGDTGGSDDIFTEVPVGRTEKAVPKQTPEGGEGASRVGRQGSGSRPLASTDWTACTDAILGADGSADLG